MSKIRSLSKFGENCINGFLAEIIAIQDFRDNGYHIKKTGIGSDFIAFRKIPGGIDETYVEVKFGSSELTQLQKKQKFLAKKFDTQFFEYRVTREFLENYKNTIKVYEIAKHPTTLTIQRLCLQYSSLGFFGRT